MPVASSGMLAYQVDSLLWQVFPDCLQHSLEFSLVGWLWSEHFVPLKHSAPDLVVERIEVRCVWWPLILLDELRTMLLDPFFNEARRMLEYEVRHLVGIRSCLAVGFYSPQ